MAGNGLHASDGVDFIGSTEVHGGDDGGMGCALKGRRGGDDALDARSLRGDDAHVGGGDHGIASAGHVAADTVHWNVLVAQHDAREGFDFYILQRRLLHQSEVANLSLRKLDVFDHLGRQGAEAVSDFDVREPERLRRPFVELLRILAHGLFAVGADVGEDGLDGVAHLQCAFRFHCGGLAAF